MDKNAKYNSDDIKSYFFWVALPFLFLFLFLIYWVKTCNFMPEPVLFKTIELEDRDYVIDGYWWVGFQSGGDNIHFLAKNKSGESRFLKCFYDVQQDSIAFFKIKKDTASIVLYGKPDTFHLFLPRKFEDIKITEGLDK
jgi:hypothetical protein